MKIPTYITNTANTLLAPYGFNIATLNAGQIELLPPLVRTTVKNLVSPYGKIIGIEQESNVIHRERYLPVVKAENYCGVSRYTLSRAVKSGLLKQIKLSKARSGKVLYDRNELDKWLEVNQTKAI